MRRIPALSIWRPWTTLILSLGKDVENRGWTTSHRGPVWIHGAKAWQELDLDWVQNQAGIEPRLVWTPTDHPTGILGLVDLVGVCDTDIDLNRVTCDCGIWANPGQYHWRLANPRPLPEPVPHRGFQGLWYPTGDAAAMLGEFAVKAGV